MTPQQRQLLDFIRGRIETVGVAPTVREMAKHLGVSGVGNTHAQLNELIAQGHLVREQDGVARWRNIKLAGSGPTATAFASLASVPTSMLQAELARREGASCPRR